MAKSIARNLADVASPTGVLDGTLSTAAQTNITSVGTLSSLTISGNLNATLTTAAQPNITSLGTLTALTVDNLGINGNTITASSGALNLTPASGSAIVLDGTINVDAGVVTGATSITSTAFVGGLTGNVTGNASGTAATVTGAAQTNITSVGTLSALTVSGDLTVDTSTLKVDSSNNRVGIGATSPGVPLHIASTSQARIALDTTAGNTRRFDIVGDSNGFTIRDQSAAANRMTIDTSGNATFTGTISSGAISATGAANPVGAAHAAAIVTSGSYGGGFATRDTAESGWYQQTYGADWHFYHNRNVSSDTPQSKKVLSFNSTGDAIFQGKVGIGTTSAPAGLPLQTKVSSGDNKLRMTTANKDAFILELKDATGDVHLGTNTTAGALVIEDDGDVYVGGKFAVNNAPISGTQVYIKKLDANTNLMRWGEGDGSTADSYRFRIDQTFDFIANSGSGDTFLIDSDTGSVSIGHGGVPGAKVDIVSTGSATYSGSSTGSNIALRLRNLESGAANRTIGMGLVCESNGEIYLNAVTNSINNGADFYIATRHAGTRRRRFQIMSDGRQINMNQAIVTTNEGVVINMGFMPHAAAYGSGTTSGRYLHMKLTQPAGGVSASGVNVMGRYEYKGFAYGSGFLDCGCSFYTYVGTSTPYAFYSNNQGAGNGMSAYYSSDNKVVIVVDIIANNYSGGILYFQAGSTHYITDNQVASINYSANTTGVF